MKVICPCCGKPGQQRLLELSEFECERAYAVMLAKHVTREQLLGKHRAAIDYIAPGLSDWLTDLPRREKRIAEEKADPFYAFRDLALTT